MGLDMFLHAKRYLFTSRKGDAAIAEQIQKQFPELEGFKDPWGDGPAVNCVTVEVAYWRKANAVHNWFVRNVQKDVDDCGYYYVPRSKLVELRSICEDILDNPEDGEKLLPTQSGFFFGSTSYDQFYIQDLTRTVQQLDEALKLPEDWSFEYHASW